MNISNVNVDALNAVLTIEIEKADYEPRVEKALKEHAKKAAVKGFRPGHAPIAIIKKMYGNSVLIHEVDTLVSESLSNYIKENNIDILGEPLPNKDQEPIDFDKDQDKITFKFDLGLSPEFSVNLDNSITVPSYTITVADADVDNQIKSFCGRFGSHVPVEVASAESLVRGTLTLGDRVNEKALASVAVIKDETEKAKFVGAKAGDTLEFDIRKAFADDREIAYLAAISDEEAKAVAEGTLATLKIAEVSDFKEAEINEDLFKKLYPNDNIADEATFRARVKENIVKTNELSQAYRFNLDARKAISDKVGAFDLPEEFLKRWLTAVNRDNDKFTPEVLVNEFPKFIEDLKWQVIKNKIVKANDIKLEYNDVLEQAKKVVTTQFLQYGITNFPEDQMNNYAAQMLQNEEQRRHITEGAIEDKIFLVAKEKVNVEQKEIDNEGFNKLFEASK